MVDPQSVWLPASRLDPYAGVFVQAAVAIGPEFGTVGPEFIREAAKEAVKIADLLVVCGFAFDPVAGRPPGQPTMVQRRTKPPPSEVSNEDHAHST